MRISQGGQSRIHGATIGEIFAFFPHARQVKIIRASGR
jgi:hypothetical protein